MDTIVILRESKTLEKNTRSAARGSVLDSRNITIVPIQSYPPVGRVQAQKMMGNPMRTEFMKQDK